MSSLSQNPAVTISRRAAKQLEQGHVWVYRSEIVSAKDVPPGALIDIRDERGRFLASGLYSSSSQIAIRKLSSLAVDDLAKLLRERIRAAVSYRNRFVEDTDAYRVIFSEADGLPGLIVDHYNDQLAMQVVTQAMDAAPVRAVVIEELVGLLKPAHIFERAEPRIRILEELPPRDSGLVYSDDESRSDLATIFTMNGVRFHFDPTAGQKTGAFLDQRENYAAAARYGRGEALDCFTYQGGFALHLAKNCSQVSAVDSSRPALEIADRNAALNFSATGRTIEWIEANCFDLLRDYSDAKKEYDCIVLDPPAFAKSKRTLDTALRGYKELNLRALKMLRDGGILVTCSCSFHVSQADFLQIVSEAAVDAHRTLRILEVRGQAKDHPVVPNIPETGYLKCVISNVSH
jgi:23S rRNA (cytosine1962-C5)-methyltransferase